jgi:hypothetical protein
MFGVVSISLCALSTATTGFRFLNCSLLDGCPIESMLDSHSPKAGYSCQRRLVLIGETGVER